MYHSFFYYLFRDLFPLPVQQRFKRKVEREMGNEFRTRPNSLRDESMSALTQQLLLCLVQLTHQCSNKYGFIYQYKYINVVIYGIQYVIEGNSFLSSVK